MVMLLMIGFIFALVMFPHLRNIVFHPILTLTNAPVDIYEYIKYKKWNECKAYGRIDMYCSDTSKVFGNGKTLSGVNYVRNLYKQYDGKLIFDDGEWIKQRIIVLSNVMFKDIPYIHLYQADQITNRHDVMKRGEVLIVYIDEAGIIFNSRNFKDNIGQDLLNAMLTCRKKKFGMLFTAQRFNQTDALIRQLTSRVYMAEKWWRSVVLRCYAGYDMEYCANYGLLPCTTSGYFATNKLFWSYDTNQGVEDLKKKVKNNEMLSDREILEAQGNSISDGLHNVSKLNRKGRKVLKG